MFPLQMAGRWANPPFYQSWHQKHIKKHLWFSSAPKLKRLDQMQIAPFWESQLASAPRKVEYSYLKRLQTGKAGVYLYCSYMICLLWVNVSNEHKVDFCLTYSLSERFSAQTCAILFGTFPILRHLSNISPKCLPPRSLDPCDFSDLPSPCH